MKIKRFLTIHHRFAELRKGLLLVLACSVFGVNAHQHTQHQAILAPVSAIAAAFDSQQQLWLAEVNAQHLYVSKSADFGRTFTAVVKVNPSSMRIAARGEARPQMALGGHDELYVVWKAKGKHIGSANVWFSRSTNQGEQFDKPILLHAIEVGVTHREPAIQVSNTGKITVFWLQATHHKHKPNDSAVYYVVSDDKGEHFSQPKKLASNSCECCRIATTSKSDGTPVAFWRHVFDGMQRDHMLAEVPKVDQAPELHRASFGRWQVDGCPHHGGAIARGGEGNQWWGYHLAYYDGKEKKPGLYYTRMDGNAWARVPAKRFGDTSKQASHPALWAGQVGGVETVWRVWRETHARKHRIIGQYSDDGGRSWQTPITLAASDHRSDYPMLINSREQVYLVWNTVDGLVVKALNKDAHETTLNK